MAEEDKSSNDGDVAEAEADDEESKAKDDGSPNDGDDADADVSAPSTEKADSTNKAGTTDKGRRLHTLSGALALGAFLIEHLFTNASALGGEERFESIVGVVERSKLLPIVEIVFILIPLGFHVGYGLVLLRRSGGGADAVMDRYGDRRLWVVQRISGTVVLAFLLVHLWELRLQKLFFGLRPEAFYTTLTGHLSWTWMGVPWMALLYLVGLVATTFHFSNGLFAATAAWGVWTDNRRLARIVSSTLGVVLFLVGGGTVIGIATGTRLLPVPEHDSAPCGSAAPPLPTVPSPSPRPAPSQ